MEKNRNSGRSFEKKEEGDLFIQIKKGNGYDSVDNKSVILKNSDKIVKKVSIK